MNEKRDKFVHIAFTENELKEIDKYRKEFNTTRSNFIRNAIIEKIRRIKNPNIYNEIGLGSINQKLLEKLLRNQERQEKYSKIISKKVEVLDKILTNLALLREERKNLVKEEQIIINLLKDHKKLKPLKLIELSKLPSNIVYDVISNDKLFSITMNGELKLNDND